MFANNIKIEENNDFLVSVNIEGKFNYYVFSSGRKIKATKDHPFLININNEYKWKKLEDLKINDLVVIRHTINYIPDENTTIININKKYISTIYHDELLQLNLINCNIEISKLKILYS
jgi:intein/homing endonuclease